MNATKCNVGMSAIMESLKDEAKREEFNEARTKHEKLFDASDDQVRDIGGKVRIPEWLTAVNSESDDGQETQW